VQVEPIDGRACRVEVGSDSPAMLALWLGMLDADFEVEGSPELDEHLRALGHRYLRAGRGRAGEG
jgi:hypothetical protein